MRITTLLLLLLCLPVFAYPQATTSETVEDNSPAWSPLRISGTVNFTEQVIGNSVSSSSEYELQGQNTSSKDIVLIIMTFEEASSSIGAGVRHIIQKDLLFSPLKQGESLVLDRSTPGFRTSHCCVNPLLPKGQATAKATILYVQFADGTSLGDAATAKDVLTERAATLKALRDLDLAKNDDDFQIRLSTMHTEQTGGVLEKIRKTEKDEGTDAARRQLHKLLITAEQVMSKLIASQK